MRWQPAWVAARKEQAALPAKHRGALGRRARAPAGRLGGTRVGGSAAAAPEPKVSSCPARGAPAGRRLAPTVSGGPERGGAGRGAAGAPAPIVSGGPARGCSDWGAPRTPGSPAAGAGDAGTVALGLAVEP
jgi:hypothetical protein